MNPLTTIRNLIALACSSHSEEEARTSALAACKAIKRHDVTLTLPAAPFEVTGDFTVPTSDPFSPSYRSPPARDPFPSAKSPRAPRAKRAASKNHFEKEGFNREGFSGPMNRARRIVNKWQAWCKGCGVECKEGETIFWRRDVGTSCLACGSKVLET